VAAQAKDYYDTVNVIAIDRRGDIASGVSTSGWLRKYPGRAGDSPGIGAGNHADNRYGACACTGYGEMAICSSTAHSVVLYLKMGLVLPQASREAMTDLRHLTVPFPPRTNLVAVDARGRHVAMTHRDRARSATCPRQGAWRHRPSQRRLVVALAPGKRLARRAG
jgi:isoaspartyl peptidase/L-asparaginase-like protein (Ntn-hydrolase superfamily)